MWTNENRCRYDRSKLRYPSDLTVEEWGLIEPLTPPAKPGGNKRTVDMCEVVNGLMCILSTGVPVAVDPKGFGCAQHDQPLLRPLDRGWDRRSHPSRAVCSVPRIG